MCDRLDGGSKLALFCLAANCQSAASLVHFKRVNSSAEQIVLIPSLNTECKNKIISFSLGSEAASEKLSDT